MPKKLKQKYLVYIHLVHFNSLNSWHVKGRVGDLVQKHFLLCWLCRSRLAELGEVEGFRGTANIENDCLKVEQARSLTEESAEACQLVPCTMT